MVAADFGGVFTAEPTTVSIVSAQTVSLTTASAASTAIGTANTGQPARTELVRLCSDVACYVKIGTSAGESPTAVAAAADNVRLAADAAEYLDIPAGAKIAAIVASGTGALNIARCSKVN